MILVQKAAPESIIDKFWRVVSNEFENMEIPEQYQPSIGVCNFYWKLSQVFYGPHEDSFRRMTDAN